MSIRNLLDQAKHEIELPQIRGESCVHSLIEQASCQACVDACPRDAWLLDDAELGLDTEACDGCGLCCAACPQSAIAHYHRPEPCCANGRDIAFVACERAGVEGEGVMPCLHAIDLSLLIQMSRRGVRTLICTRGECSGCDRSARTQSFDELTKNFRRLADSHGLPGLSTQDHGPREWKAGRERLATEPYGHSASRRGFLRGLIGHTVEQGVRAVSGETDSEPAVHLSAVLPASEVEGIFPHVPRFDPRRCVGCDACINVCPHDAILLQDGPSRYTVDARCCVGCGLCVDVCDAHAMTVRAWSDACGQTVELRQGVCEVCGATFAYPKERDDETSLCRICAARGRKKWNLYQVMEN